MFNRNTLITIGVVILVTIGATIIGTNLYTKRTDQKKRAEFDAALAVSKQINEKLRQERDEAIKKGDEHQALAEKETQKVAGLQAELARFGAAGAAAVKRQEDAAKTYEKDKTDIRSSTDACALCNWLCDERAKQSTDELDYRCPADYCGQYCQQAQATPAPTQ